MKANVGDWLVIKGTTTERADERARSRMASVQSMLGHAHGHR
jgi:hypothetical protein